MPLTTNLVSYWKLDESSGNAADSVGGNTLTNNGTVTYSAGKINNAADFDGSTDYLSKTDNAALSITNNLSISCWINQGAGRITNDIIVAKSMAANLGYELRIRNSAGADWAPTTYISQTGDNVTEDQWYTATGYINSTGTWYHIVTTYASGTCLIYVNASSIGLTNSGGTTSIFDNTTAFTVGARADPLEYFHGSIDEVGIWNRVLSAAEVTTLYNGGAGNQYPFGEAAAAANHWLLMGV